MKKLIVLFAFLLFLPGCWFFILPVGPIISAVRGDPQYCVGTGVKVGNVVTVDNKAGTVTKIHGPCSTCPNYLIPIGASIDFPTEPTKSAENIEFK